MSNINLDEILMLSPSVMGKYCEDLMSAESLEASVDDRSPFSRKGLCEYLGIGESTLSGWFKEGRVPQMAKNSFALLIVHKVLCREIERLRRQLEESGVSDLRVIKTGDHFMICDFREDEAGDVIGRVVAERVSTIEDARLLASGRRALRLAREAEPFFDYVSDMSQNDEFLDHLREVEAKFEAHELFLTNYSNWKQRFGKPETVQLEPDQDPIDIRALFGLSAQTPGAQ